MKAILAPLCPTGQPLWKQQGSNGNMSHNPTWFRSASFRKLCLRMFCVRWWEDSVADCLSEIDDNTEKKKLQEKRENGGDSCFGILNSVWLRIKNQRLIQTIMVHRHTKPTDDGPNLLATLCYFTTQSNMNTEVDCCQKDPERGNPRKRRRMRKWKQESIGHYGRLSDFF